MQTLALRLLSLSAAALTLAAAPPAAMRTGKVELRSAGPLAFGPGAVLFVGDSTAAAIVAIDTGDTKSGEGSTVDVKGINQKIAALLGTEPGQIMVNDLAVNPISRRTYLSISRGRGPDAKPVIVRVDASGKVEEFSLDNVPHARVALPNVPDAAATDRRGASLRQEAITDIAFTDGKVVVAGLSNEEFSSKLRVIPYPFANADNGSSIEIYHGSHGRFETNAPVRTFVPYTIDAKSHVLAAYTCTPLVTFPVSDLKPGSKVSGKTIAELGNRNRPLDMIVYKKAGSDFILMANSSRGVMKLPAKGLGSYESITQPTELKGVPYETIESLKGVTQLDKVDESTGVVIIASDSGAMDLKSIALP